MQDAAMTASMGSIVNRANEHLSSADAMVIRVRRRLIAAVQAYLGSGEPPPGVEHPRGVSGALGWRRAGGRRGLVESTRELRRAFVEHPQLDPALNGPL